MIPRPITAAAFSSSCSLAAKAYRTLVRSIGLPAIAALCLSLVTVCSGHAATITGLYSTGVDASGNLLPGGSADPHYTASAPGAPYSGSAHVLSQGNYWSTWPKATSTGQWINYIDSSNTAVGDVTFTTTFNLTGLDPNSAVIQLNWTGDNNAEVFLNGHLEASNGDFTTLINSTISSGFVAGLNTLTFTVNEDTFDGLFVSSISGTANQLSSTPLPAALPMFAGGLGVMGLFGWRRKRKPAAIV